MICTPFRLFLLAVGVIEKEKLPTNEHRYKYVIIETHLLAISLFPLLLRVEKGEKEYKSLQIRSQLLINVLSTVKKRGKRRTDIKLLLI